MQLRASLANAAWMMANLRSYQRFRGALRNPAATQQAKLLSLLRENESSAVGKAHKFATISNYEEFTRRVPLIDYDDLQPWINRIRDGEQNVLTRDRVTHLVPTSGSSSARKLIPFTRGLQNDFDAALGPWLVDMSRRFPSVLGGPAYWSITPSLVCKEKTSAIPIGFEADTEYLGGLGQFLASAIMAVPPNVRSAKSLEAFQFETWRHLLSARELRLISVWHPSFLTLLLDALPPLWKGLLSTLASRGNAQRARELAEVADPAQPATFWPKLRLISCWGDANACDAMRALSPRFPNVTIERKGLIATEGIVTFPFQNAYPLAIRSHFFEFIGAENKVHCAEQLRCGEEYEVVLTTSGGLWRYRLKDRVCVTGFLEHMPTLEFVGRGDDVSDVCGEKLSERFVRESLHELFGEISSAFAMLAPEQDKAGWRYVLFLEAPRSEIYSDSLDHLLRRNPHYAYCRDLGQLLEPRVFRIGERAYETFATRLTSNGSRLGDIKPACLSRLPNWSEYFSKQD